MVQIADDLAATLLAASPDGLLLVDVDGVIRVANNSAATIFGYSEGDLVGLNVDALVPAEHRERHERLRAGYLQRPATRPMGTDLRLLAEHRSGELFPVEISLSPLTSHGESLTIATVRDVSERQEAMARVALLDDRERIARDIHDMVIQRIFAAGMSLQAILGLIDSAVVRERISSVTDDLDETIRQLRAAIFELGQRDEHRSLSSHIAAIVEERSRHLGFTPQLSVSGRLDELPEFIADQLIATLTEALSNVARHANATAASVEVSRVDSTIRLSVSDNGRGVASSPKPRGGLANMMWRAAELGGSCTIAPRDPTGTVVAWTVPVGSS